MKATDRGERGFTLLELIIVIAIIGILVVIVIYALGDSRVKALDSRRISDAQEVLKALELYYADNQLYPLHDGGSDTGGPLSDIEVSLYGIGNYINKLPDEAGSRFYYCVSGDRQSILLAINTEIDNGPSGSDYCRITVGSGPYGCTYSGGTPDVDADDLCSDS